MNKRISILDIKVSVVNNDNVTEIVSKLVSEKKQIQITTPNAEHVMLAQRDRDFKKTINGSDLAIPDGMSVVKVMRKKMDKEDRGLVNRVTGVDLTEKLCELAVDRNWKVGLMGSNDEVRNKAKRILSNKYEGINVECLESHKNIRQSREEDEKILTQINKDRIDVLLVAYGAPEQEKWIASNLNKTQVKIAMGVGGALDFISGEIKRAPIGWQENGREWLWRLFQEPWRWRRQLRLIKFWLKTR